MQRGNISTVAQWGGGGEIKFPGKVLEKNLTGEHGIIVLGLKLFYFLIFWFWDRFSQKSPLFWASNAHPVIWGDWFTFADLFLSGTILSSY